MRFHKKSGFTIVELIIVIVIIGILTLITIVVFSGVNQRAREAALQADLKSSANKLEVFKIDNFDRYPDSLAAAGINDTETVQYQYTYNAGTNEFCVTAFPVVDGLTPFYIDNTSGGVALAGSCVGHVDPGEPEVVLATTYTQRTAPGTANWRAVAISGDGQKW